MAGMSMRMSRVAAVAAATGLCAAGGVAWAVIPDGAGVIHGCYDSVSGALRVTDSPVGVPRPCQAVETALDWNRGGPQGPQGPQGPAGPPGPAGAPATPADRQIADVVADSWTAGQRPTLRAGAGFVTVATVHHTHGSMQPCIFDARWTMSAQNLSHADPAAIARSAVVARAAQIDSDNRSTLTLRLLVDGRPDARAFSKTIEWRARETIDGGLPLQLPQGAHAIALQARVSGANARLGAGILNGIIINGVVVDDG